MNNTKFLTAATRLNPVTQITSKLSQFIFFKYEYALTLLFKSLIKNLERWFKVNWDDNVLHVEKCLYIYIKKIWFVYDCIPPPKNNATIFKKIMISLSKFTVNMVYTYTLCKVDGLDEKYLLLYYLGETDS